MPRSELLCAPRHAKLSALLGPRPWHWHVTVAALAVERQETSLLAQGTHRLPSEFLWIWSERNVSNASNWGRTLKQNRSVFVSKKARHALLRLTICILHVLQAVIPTNISSLHRASGSSKRRLVSLTSMSWAWDEIRCTYKSNTQIRRHISKKKLKYQHLSPFDPSLLLLLVLWRDVHHCVSSGRWRRHVWREAQFALAGALLLQQKDSTLICAECKYERIV